MKYKEPFYVFQLKSLKNKRKKFFVMLSAKKAPQNSFFA